MRCAKSANMRTKTSGQGRPKGTPNKLTKTVKEAFEIAFQDLQNEPGAKLSDWAKGNPTDFYRIASKLIPNELNATIKGNLAHAIQGLPVVDPPGKD